MPTTPNLATTVARLPTTTVHHNHQTLLIPRTMARHLRKTPSAAVAEAHAITVAHTNITMVAEAVADAVPAAGSVATSADSVAGPWAAATST